MQKYTKNDLEQKILVEKQSYTKIGKEYGVSGNAIKKAAIRFGIPIYCRRRINPKEVFSHKGIRLRGNYVFRIDDVLFKSIIETSSTWKDIGKKLGYSNAMSSNAKDAVIERCSQLDISLNISSSHEENDSMKKKELFSKRKNWQSARGSIVRDAKNKYMKSGRMLSCAICGYNKHIEIAHIKPVSSFNDEATIGEINSIDNLIALCPTHHWEYDNGLFNLKG